jgi:hypothetical protein
VPLRQVPDARDVLVGDPHLDELLQAALRSHHPEGAVPGADQFDGGFDDGAQHRAEVELFDDGLVRPEEAAQPALRIGDPLRGRDERRQGEIELGLGTVGEEEAVRCVHRLVLSPS